MVLHFQKSKIDIVCRYDVIACTCFDGIHVLAAFAWVGARSSWYCSDGPAAVRGDLYAEQARGAES